MSQLSNIVVGVDGRPEGWDALALGQRLANIGHGQLTVACAFPAAGFAHTTLMWSAIREETDARRVLAEARAHLSDPGGADFIAICGSMPGPCLHDAAAERHADLLVLGGSEHGAVGRVLGGSVLMSVLVDPTCPVAVPPRGHANGSRHIARVGVAVDGSPEALAAVHWARGLALDDSAIREVRLLSADTGSTSHAHTRGHSELLAGMTTADARGGAGLKVSWTQAPGPIADRLVDLSLSLDLLVIGTHGRGGLSRLVHGSISADVARGAHCPVVAVPAGHTD